MGQFDSPEEAALARLSTEAFSSSSVARAFLTVIGREPEAVKSALRIDECHSQLAVPFPVLR
jgi:hypothetical protein